MTIKESILSFEGLSGVNQNAIDRILVTRLLTGASDFDSTVAKQVNLAAADLYVELVNSPDFSEGNLSVSHPRKYFLQTASRLYRANGETDKANSLFSSIKITGKSINRW